MNKKKRKIIIFISNRIDYNNVNLGRKKLEKKKKR